MSYDLRERLEEVLSNDYQVRFAKKTPHPDRVPLKQGAAIYEGTVLYSDIVGSTALGDHFGYDDAAKILQAFLLGASHLVKFWDGDITAYDGDRLMAVFGGPDQEDNAVDCAFSMAYLTREILSPMIDQTFQQESGTTDFKCCCGVDSGELFAVKIGLRGNTDLLWSGRPANLAAKLCAHRNPFYQTVITGRVFQHLSDETKRSHTGSFWERLYSPQVNMNVFGSHRTTPIPGV